MMTLAVRAGWLCCALTLAGCAVGPDFTRPDAPKVDHYTALKLTLDLPEPSPESSPDQQLLAGADVPADWWKMFGSEDLNALVEHGLSNSPTIEAAKARLREVQENLNSQVGSVLYPSIDASGSGSRKKISGASFGGHAIAFTLLDASISASYGLDLFGASKRYLESLRSQVDYEQYQMQAARMTLAANIVTSAVKEASLRHQIEATRRIIDDSQSQMNMVEKQYALGAVPQSAVLSQRSALVRARTALPTLQKSLQQNRHLLNVLVGELPSDTDLSSFTLAGLQLPKTLPLSLPSEFVRQRPDILASEALLHQASANVGVATANMYPRITLTGNYGSEGVKASDLFTAGSSVWGLSAGLVQPLFHGGELRAKKREAVAGLDRAQANYREVVLQSFQNVADALLALKMDGRALQLQRDAEQAAASTRSLIEQQYQAGAASYLDLLSANQQYQQASISLAQATAARLADSAALIFALGGGWWNEPGSESANTTENRL